MRARAKELAVKEVKKALGGCSTWMLVTGLALLALCFLLVRGC